MVELSKALSSVFPVASVEVEYEIPFGYSLLGSRLICRYESVTGPDGRIGVTTKLDAVSCVGEVARLSV
jgi:hypothetical protein